MGKTKSITFIATIAAFSFGLTDATFYRGFNYGTGLDYNTEFALAKSLADTDGAFASARLYTMIEQGTTSTPTSAIPAAISNDVTLLLGLWASAGQATMDLEIAALKAAVATYGTAFTSRVAAISVGSEDLYRVSPTGIENKSGVGADPEVVVDYISQVRAAVKGTALGGALIGHVDTWTSWVNGSNSAVIAASDFLGLDAYPYFQNTESNAVESAHDIFFSAYDATLAVAGSKPVWVTETGWPISGKTENLAVAGSSQAQQYWNSVGCQLFNSANTYWYILNDAGATPSFGISAGSSAPLFNLTCASVQSVSSSSVQSLSSSSSSAVVTARSSSTVVSGVVAKVTSTMQSSVSVKSTLLATETGSPKVAISSSADSSIAHIESASSAAYSSAASSASALASAALTDSTATISSAGTSSATSSATSTTSAVEVLASGTDRGTRTASAATGTATGGVGRVALGTTGRLLGLFCAMAAFWS